MNFCFNPLRALKVSPKPLWLWQSLLRPLTTLLGIACGRGLTGCVLLTRKAMQDCTSRQRRLSINSENMRSLHGLGLRCNTV